ncbi:MAG: PDZ domain-containing protein, partial [Nitrospinales bacterium]
NFVDLSYYDFLDSKTHEKRFYLDDLITNERDMSHSSTLYLGDFAWILEYKVLHENKVKLGVQLQEADSGINVIQVGENSNAQKAGIQVGDVLLAMNGENLVGVDDLVDRLQTFNIGDRAVVRLRRGEEELELDVLLREVNP